MASEGDKQLPEEILAAIADAYSKYRERLIAYAEPWGIAPDIAENLVQDTFLVILQQPEKYMNCTNKFAWLSTILRHHMEHLLRDIHYALLLKAQLEQQSDLTHEDEISLWTLYDGVIDRMNLEMLILHYVDGIPYKELGMRYNMEETNCRSGSSGSGNVCAGYWENKRVRRITGYCHKHAPSRDYIGERGEKNV
jgi:DNA-directed RNA polymerase specialized sigma24 family protein